MENVERESKTTEKHSLHLPPEVHAFGEDIGRIDLFTSTTMALLRELLHGNLTTKQLAAKISQDPTLSGSLLKLANSAYYGIPNRVSTVGHAVSLLGFTTVRNLIQGLCLVEFDRPGQGEASGLVGKSFAAHSMAVSKMAGVLTKKFGFPSLGQGEAETAGLLHDIGHLLMAAGRKTEFENLLNEYDRSRSGEGAIPAEHKSLLAMEREVFGFTHPELGTWLAQAWNLPLMIQEALMHHHGRIDDCLHRESATVVHLANLICNENGMGCLPEGCWADADPSVIRFLESHNKLEVYERLPQSLEKEIAGVREIYEMVRSGMKKGAEARETASPKTSENSVRKTRTESRPESRSGWNWKAVVPGYSLIQSNNKSVGYSLIGVFIFAAMLSVAALSSGNPIVGFASLAAAALAWGVSILSD